MNANKALLTIALAVLFLGYPQQPMAKEFTSSELLAWEQKDQDWFFQVSVTMAAFVVVKQQPEKAACINDWYFTDTRSANNGIRNKIAEFKDFHPSSIVMAVIDKKCG